LVFISREGMVQRTGVKGISRYGRASQGVRVMNLREGDAVSAVALVVESTETAAQVSAPAAGEADAAPRAVGGDDGAAGEEAETPVPAAGDGDIPQGDGKPDA
jgi:DNA gyrase subunit A